MVASQGRAAAASVRKAGGGARRREKAESPGAPPGRGAARGTAAAREGKKAGVRARAVRALADSTSSIVQKAALILEEEIAAGIVAAKEVESKLVNVAKLRAGESNDIMQRVRKDAHEIADILVDIVILVTRYVVDLTRPPGSARAGGEEGLPERAAAKARRRRERGGPKTAKQPASRAPREAASKRGRRR